MEKHLAGDKTEGVGRENWRNLCDRPANYGVTGSTNAEEVLI